MDRDAETLVSITCMRGWVSWETIHVSGGYVRFIYTCKKLAIARGPWFMIGWVAYCLG